MILISLVLQESLLTSLLIIIWRNLESFVSKFAKYLIQLIYAISCLKTFFLLS